ncbi:MAG: ribonuclease HII [Clostridia bacterium]|nr:ribonuclease HII [Clostridia bacterium]
MNSAREKSEEYHWSNRSFDMKETERKRLEALIGAERQWRELGLNVGGIDEVGRGPLAGPVTVACVCLPDEPLIEYVNDSKKVTEKRRITASEEIRRIAASYKIVSVGPDIIDEINILNATKKAMREAAVAVSPDVLLIDAVVLEGLPFDSVSIIKGDSKSYSIAAASILAKVHRDTYMLQMDELYPQYGFARNKGYGTAEHIEALRKHGPCPIHRKSFIKKILTEC